MIEMKSLKQKSRFGSCVKNIKSEIINSFTTSIKLLSLNLKENFEVIYSNQSKDSLYFNGKNKGFKCGANQIMN